MRILIKDEDNTLEIDNEDLDNDNFVDLTITDEMDNDYCITVSLDKLQAAIGAFMELRELNAERDERCSV